MTVNTKQTTEKMAELASKVLRNQNVSEEAKSLAGSVLSQYNSGKQTGAELEELASKVLRNESSTEDEKSLAASVLSQANKER